MTDIETARSTDGTSIAFETLGEGPPLVLIGGLMCDRAKMRDLATAFSRYFTVINFDRRGRGRSENVAPYSKQKEIDDIAALLNISGPESILYGHSSGAGLALLAAGAGLPFKALVLHEPPYGPDDPDSIAQTREFSQIQLKMIAEKNYAAAVRHFYSAIGMGEEEISGLIADRAFMAMVPTMAHDIAVMGEIETGGVVPEDIVKSLELPVFVLTGEESLPFFRDTAEHIAALLWNAELRSLPGQDHAGDPIIVANAVRDFVAGLNP